MAKAPGKQNNVEQHYKEAGMIKEPGKGGAKVADMNQVHKASMATRHWAHLVSEVQAKQQFEAYMTGLTKREQGAG
eukprot:9671430-Prorocentrum_lima.AAC.1